jgi:hypothetical protein
MANLSEETKDRIVKGLMNYWSRLWEETGVSVQDLDAAVDATDVWVEDNSAAFNAALPANAQTGLTPSQKAAMFCAVTLARFDPDTLRRIFPEA